MNEIKINGKIIGNKQKPFTIAEIGVNHNGDVKIAKKLISLAKDSGVDAVKFQYHIPDKEMLKEVPHSKNFEKPLWDILEETNLKLEEQIELKKYCEEMKITYLCTPFSREAVDILDEIGIVAFKTGSGELTNLPLMKHISKKNKPIIISTGMSYIEEIEDTVKVMKKANAEFMLMHCTSAYPTKYEDVNLKMIPKLIDLFDVPVGLSDHSLGIYTSLASVSLGACVLEKHFTLNKNFDGPDHKVSLEPKELTELVIGADAVFKSLGDTKKIFEDEKQIVSWARESVVSLVDIKKEEIIKPNDVWVKRPGTGIPAKELELVIGMKTKIDIPKDSQIRWGDLEKNEEEESSDSNGY